MSGARKTVVRESTAGEIGSSPATLSQGQLSSRSLEEPCGVKQVTARLLPFLGLYRPQTAEDTVM
jgi:hypothetical protein